MRAAQMEGGAQHQLWGRVEFGLSSSTSNDRSQESMNTRLVQKLKGVSLRSESATSESQSLAEDTDDSKAWIDGRDRVSQQVQDFAEIGHGEDEKAEGTSNAPFEVSNSVGSAQHDGRKCRPCHYVHTRLGCLAGEECVFCHLDHPKRHRPRPCKSRRDKCKQLASVLDTVRAEDPMQFSETVNLLSMRCGYLGKVVKSKLRRIKAQEALEAQEAERVTDDTQGPRLLVSL